MKERSYQKKKRRISFSSLIDEIRRQAITTTTRITIIEEWILFSSIPPLIIKIPIAWHAAIIVILYLTWMYTVFFPFPHLPPHSMWTGTHNKTHHIWECGEKSIWRLYTPAQEHKKVFSIEGEIWTVKSFNGAFIFSPNNERTTVNKWIGKP